MIALRVLLLLALLLSAVSGQETTSRTYLQRVGDGLITTVTAPTMRRHWTLTGLSILGCLPVDQPIQDHAKDQGLMPQPLADFAYDWGGKWAAVGILPGIYLTGKLRDTPHETILRHLDFAFSSLAMVGITTELIKYAVGRPRPDKEAKTSFPYGHSFPSGHASAAFGVAEVVRTLYGNRAGSVFYSLAVITGLSRMHENAHYLSDVVGGAGLAIGLVRGFDLAMRNSAGSDWMLTIDLRDRLVLSIVL